VIHPCNHWSLAPPPIRAYGGLYGACGALHRGARAGAQGTLLFKWFVSSPTVAGTMSSSQWAIRVTCNDVISSKWIVSSCWFVAQVTVGGGVPYYLGLLAVVVVIQVRPSSLHLFES
jgi:hypothetical protein